MRVVNSEQEGSGHWRQSFALLSSSTNSSLVCVNVVPRLSVAVLRGPGFHHHGLHQHLPRWAHSLQLKKLLSHCRRQDLQK